TINYYDDEGRVVRVWKQHYKGGTVAANSYDEITNTYNFAGEMTASVRRHFVAGVEKLHVANRFTYDHMGRPKDTYQKTGDVVSTTNKEILLSRKTYNEVGQLSVKQLHAKNLITPVFAQTISYGYNARGWLKSSGSTWFNQTLNYEEVISGVTPQYNGNISRQLWGTAANPALHNFVYSYDNLNRLTLAKSEEGKNETIGYDLMGNITRLKRDSSATVSTDRLRYDYTNGRLTQVYDSVLVKNPAYQLPLATTYAYNTLNGNLTSRSNAVKNNNLSNITYNHLNLPVTLTVGDGATVSSLTYTYDVDGTKLKKLVTGANALNNEYISGIHYENAVLKFVQTAEGRVLRSSATDYKYEYAVGDHLGNGRVYFEVDTANVATRKQEVDYYAFGMEIERQISSPKNLYLYNGKEKQEHEKLFDYGARQYDPVIGRWNVPDPLAELAPNLTPFRYCFNNPVNYIDPFGLWETTAGGYKTDKKDDIERFMDYLSIEKNSNKTNPSFSQMSTFIDGEMKSGGLGTLSDGSQLAKGFTITKQKDFYGGNHWVTDKKSYSSFWHSVEADRNPDALDPRTIGNNILGLTYSGSNNPKTYSGREDYSYIPKYIEDVPGFLHDKDYDAKGIAGKNGLLSDPRGISADLRFAAREMLISADPNNSMTTRARAFILGAGVGFPGLYKLSKEGLKSVIQPLKVAITPPSFMR
ncbi:MAG TPA: RHS repeat-associated core domain-containing protein, partial [Pedobacter sp.]|nr:RHS repeat-associated core domain-containing protein [Pedobacter sp.]